MELEKRDILDLFAEKCKAFLDGYAKRGAEYEAGMEALSSMAASIAEIKEIADVSHKYADMKLDELAR